MLCFDNNVIYLFYDKNTNTNNNVSSHVETCPNHWIGFAIYVQPKTHTDTHKHTNTVKPHYNAVQNNMEADMSVDHTMCIYFAHSHSNLNVF